MAGIRFGLALHPSVLQNLSENPGCLFRSASPVYEGRRIRRLVVTDETVTQVFFSRYNATRRMDGDEGLMQNGS